MQIAVPERIHYRAIHDNGEYCHCRFFADIFVHMVDEDLTPEEERRLQLEWEISHLKKKHGANWMRYYPYYLDLNYDDEYGNPYMIMNLGAFS